MMIRWNSRAGFVRHMAYWFPVASGLQNVTYATPAAVTVGAALATIEVVPATSAEMEVP